MREWIFLQWSCMVAMLLCELQVVPKAPQDQKRMPTALIDDAPPHDAPQHDAPHDAMRLAVQLITALVRPAVGLVHSSRGWKGIKGPRSWALRRSERASLCTLSLMTASAAEKISLHSLATWRFTSFALRSNLGFQ